MAVETSPAVGVCLRLTREISRSQTVEEIYEAALRALADGLNISRASILLFDPDGVMRFKAWRNLSDAYREAVEGHTPWSPDSVDPQPFVVSDVAREPSLRSHLATIQAERIAAMAFIPLVTLDRVIGKFMLYYDAPRSLDNDEMQLASLIASQVAFAVARKRAEEQRAEAELARMAAMQDASRLKDEFLAVLSHELRTPLNAILGWVQMVQSGRIGAGQLPHAMEVIGRNARLQAQLIEDILDVSRIISGKLDIERMPVAIGDIIDTVVSGAQPAADAKGVRLTLQLTPTALPIDADPKRLHQVLGNVVANAIKYTPSEGRVEIRCRPDGAVALIEVEDSGVGIDPAFLPHIFERFRQADSRSTRKHGGLGLGLAIARHLVELHHGSIGADSRGVDCGTCITIRLPISIVAGARHGDAQAMGTVALLDLHGTRVLVVDDQADSRDILSAFFSHKGADVMSCQSADAALLALRSGAFGLLVADLAMPDMDGYALIERVRSVDAALPAIAVSAYARFEDRQRASTAGFNAFCAKPIDLVDLTRAVRDVLGA